MGVFVPLHDLHNSWVLKLRLCVQNKQPCQRTLFILSQPPREFAEVGTFWCFSVSREMLFAPALRNESAELKHSTLIFSPLSFPFLISCCHYLTHKMTSQYHICIVIKAQRKGFSLWESLYIYNVQRLRIRLHFQISSDDVAVQL